MYTYMPPGAGCCTARPGSSRRQRPRRRSFLLGVARVLLFLLLVYLWLPIVLFEFVDFC